MSFYFWSIFAIFCHLIILLPFFSLFSFAIYHPVYNLLFTTSTAYFSYLDILYFQSPIFIYYEVYHFLHFLAFIVHPLIFLRQPGRTEQPADFLTAFIKRRRTVVIYLLIYLQNVNLTDMPTSINLYHTNMRFWRWFFTRCSIQ